MFKLYVVVAAVVMFNILKLIIEIVPNYPIIYNYFSGRSEYLILRRNRISPTVIRCDKYSLLQVKEKCVIYAQKKVCNLVRAWGAPSRSILPSGTTLKGESGAGQTDIFRGYQAMGPPTYSMTWRMKGTRPYFFLARDLTPILCTAGEPEQDGLETSLDCFRPIYPNRVSWMDQAHGPRRLDALT
jgi:hypothetical protein